MTASWEVRSLAEIAECCLGKMLDKAKNRGTPQPYLRNVNVRWFDFDLSDLLEMRFEDGEQDRYTARNGDLLICEGGYPGRAAIWDRDEPIYFQKAIHRVRFHEPERARWVLYYLWALDANGSLKSNFTGSGIQHFTGQALARLRIPLPPLQEQRRIVAVLDEAFTAIATATANAEKNLANARELALHSLLIKTRARSARFCRLEEVSVVDWGNTNLTKSSYVVDGPALAVSAAGCDGRIGYAEHEAGVPVLSAIGARCGRMFFPEEPFTAIKNTITLTPRVGQADGKFLFYLLSSVNLPQRGSAQPFIAKSDINNFEVPMPVLDDQISLAAEMDEMIGACSELEAIYASKMDRFAELKQAILDQALSGELTEREPLAA